ncbi:uncharacterized protein isoform X2 [Takifugu rubripes]|uniref:uncharacterized protein isoform X2 n=1 Tax=Takifugu rubripes TaxID=31033 RepID=UPI0011454C6B|nr:uncharacterized protein LOC101079188 isoform X2 [Takifugu rubripes]
MAGKRADMTYKSTVINVEEGQNFILECFWPNKDLTFNLFDWKQDGDVEVFMYDAGVHYNNGRSGQDPRFQGRVSHFPEALKDGNASIQIRSAKVKDSGTYTCYFPRADPKRSTKIEVQVVRDLKDRSAEQLPGASPKPRLYTAPATPDSLWLFCEVDGAFPEPKVEFLDGAGTRILPEKNQSLVKDGRYHIEASIHVTKTDNFTCVVTQEQIHHRTSASTFVLTCRSDPSTMDAGHVGSTKIEVQVGASPKPRLYTAPATPDSLWLFCKVDGAFPEPKVEFLDGAGTRILPEKNQSLVKDGRYHIEASIHVTKTDNFTCVVTQEQIHHRTSASTFVLTYRSDPSTMDAGHVVLLLAFIISFLLNIVVIVLLRRRTGMKLRRSKGSHLEAALEDTPALL